MVSISDRMELITEERYVYWQLFSSISISIFDIIIIIIIIAVIVIISLQTEWKINMSA